MQSCAVASALCALGLAVIPVACDRETAPPPTPASATAPVASAAPSASAVPAGPWFEGAWTGGGESQRQPMELDKKQGAPKEWADEAPPSRGLGKVALALDIDADGHVSGSSTGALGNAAIAGIVEDDVLKARVLPMDADALSGTLVGERKDDRIVGTLKASSSDSLIVTTTAVTLEPKK